MSDVIRFWAGIVENTHYVCFKDGMDYHLLSKEYWGFRWSSEIEKKDGNVGTNYFIGMTNTKRKRQVEGLITLSETEWAVMDIEAGQETWQLYVSCRYKKQTSIPVNELKELLPSELFEK